MMIIRLTLFFLLFCFLINRIVLIGGRFTLTTVAVVAEDFLRREISTRVIGIPSTQNNNIDTSILESSLGFDSASKCYK